MITADRIAQLIDQVEQMDQMLLDTDPDTDLYWQMVRVRDRKVAEITAAREEES
jgi:hypothetical protein